MRTDVRPASRDVAQTAREALEARVRAIEADLAGVRARLAELPDGGEDARSDADNLLDVPTAAERFNVRSDTIRLWLRKNPELGEKHGGRWRVRCSQMRHLMGGRSG